MEDIENFEDFSFESEKKKPKFKIKITKQHLMILGIILILGVGYYVYMTYFTPKHVSIVCKTENGYKVKCPNYEILNKEGKKIDASHLTPGTYKLIIDDNEYHNGKKIDLEVSTDPEQTKEIRLDGIDIKYIDTNITVYPKLKGEIKIIFEDPYGTNIPYEIELIGDNGYYKKFAGKINKNEQEIVVGDVFCKSTRKICLGKKEYLEYKLKIKYGDIETEKKVKVYLLPDIKLKLDGETSITLKPGDNQLKEMYTVTLDKRMPKPIYNMSLEIINLDPFISSISRTKFDLSPGNSENFNVIYRYAPGEQQEYEGAIRIYKDDFEYIKKIKIRLK